MVSHGETIGSMCHVSGLHRLAGGLGDLVLHVRAGDLGDGVAVLNLDRDKLDLGVVNTVLGGDLSAGVLHGGSHGVGNSVGSGQSKGSYMGSSNHGSSSVGEGVRSEELRVSLGISFSLSLSFTLVDGMSIRSNRSSNSRSVTDGIDHLLADLLVLNLLCLYGLSGADILSGGSAELGGEDLVLCHTVASSNSMVRSSKGGSQQLGVSLGIWCGGGGGKGKEARDGKNLHFLRKVVILPTMQVELK